MANDLKTIKDNAPQILLGELAVFLHNLGKCSEEFIAKYSKESLNEARNFFYDLIAGSLLLIGKSKVEDTAVFPGKTILQNKYYNANDPQTKDFLPQSFRENFLSEKKISVPDLSVRGMFLGDFIDFQNFYWYQEIDSGVHLIELLFGKDFHLLRLCQVCHAYSSAAEKKKYDVEHIMQPYMQVYISNAFGFEAERMEVEKGRLAKRRAGLIAAIEKSLAQPLNLNLVDEENETGKYAKLAFRHALGDTQRPINDVTLWDLSHSTASFFKAALAWAYLEPKNSVWLKLISQPGKNKIDFPWQFLTISWNYDRFVQSSARIIDLLSRREYLNHAAKRVKNLLEKEYPLANQIFQDENGIVFLAPGEKEEALLELKDGTVSLREMIKQQFVPPLFQPEPAERHTETATAGSSSATKTKAEESARKPTELYAEIVPDIRCTSIDHDQDSLGFGKAIQESRDCEHTSNAEGFDKLWKKIHGGKTGYDVCPICGLRPIGYDDDANYSSKADERKVCWVCEERRVDRAKTWATNKTWAPNREIAYDRTIWIDEVSDNNNRVALLVGRFGVKEWFDEDINLCATMQKTPSFARMRRIWETTQTFWKEVTDELLPNVLRTRALGLRQARLLLYPGEGFSEKDVGEFHAYEMEFNGVRFSAVCGSHKRVFHTAENLEALKKRLGKKAETGLFGLIPGVTRMKVYEPSGYGEARSNKPKAEFVLKNVQCQQNVYLPLIPLLDYPTAFMAFVPAYEGLDLALEIKAKYDREMGKVKDRLPLTLGMVYFPREVPVAPVLDAGRRMMRQSIKIELNQTERNKTEHWQLLAIEKRDAQNTPASYDPIIYDLTFEAPERRRQITCRFDIRLGDGKPDEFHPHLLVKKQKGEATIALGSATLKQSSNLQVQRHGEPAKLEGLSNLHADYEAIWIGDLAPGDLVRMAISHFDFVFLDLAGKRFELAVPEGEVTRPHETLNAPRGPRPYLLEDLPRFKKLWELIKETPVGKNETALHGVRDLLLQKYRKWKADDDEASSYAFEALANQVICKEFQFDPEKESDKIRMLQQAIMDGSFFDCLEIYLHIMKEKFETEKRT